MANEKISEYLAGETTPVDTDRFDISIDIPGTPITRYMEWGVLRTNIDNIYNIDGTLGGNRAIDMDSNNLTFSNGGIFSVDSAAVFNDGGTDQDFRIEGLSKENLFFIDAGNDRVGFNTNLPLSDVHMQGTTSTGTTPATNTLLTVDQTGTCYISVLSGSGSAVGVLFGNQAAAIRAGIIYNHPTEELRLLGNGDVTAMALFPTRIDIPRKVAIGVGNIAQVPVSNLHIFPGTSAPVGSAVLGGTLLTLEDGDAAYLTFQHNEASTSRGSGMFWSNSADVSTGAILFDQLSVSVGNPLGFDFRVNSENDAGMALNKNKVLGIGVLAQDMDGTVINALTIGNGTAPGTNPADVFQMYSADHNGATTATVHIENEEGNTFIYKSSAAYSRNTTIVEDRTLLASASATTINNNNVLAALVADLQSQGLIG